MIGRLPKNGRILDVSPDDYHALPGLSSSVAKILLTRSPKHAHAAHGFYGGQGKKPTKAMDKGSVGHNLVLGKGKDYEILQFGDYKSKAAQAARDAARAQGKTPILIEAFEEACVLAESIRVKLADRRIVLDGQSELAVAWTDFASDGTEVECRAMFDHVWIDDGGILDLKFTENASPDSVERNAENMGYAIQAHAYQRALVALRPHLAGRTRFLFAFCETDDVGEINLSTPDGSFDHLGQQRWQRALDLWAKCLKTDEWPGYGDSIRTISSPVWALQKEELAA